MNNTYFCSERPHPSSFFRFLTYRRQYSYSRGEQLGKGWQKTIFGHVLNHRGSQNGKCFGKHQRAKINGPSIKMSYERTSSHEEKNIIFWRWCHCSIIAFGSPL
ncbi:MAG: hypothetical protein NZ744_01630, partial [Pirellulaceae bacterium]|nr:hypothetical protein [Pirellulaceae bacterium]